MANISKSALITITHGKAIGSVRTQFNIPEEMRVMFPVSDLFKMGVIGFNVSKIEFKEDLTKHLIVLICNVTRSKLLGALISYALPQDLYNLLKNQLLEANNNPNYNDEEFVLSITKAINSRPPVIQIMQIQNKL